MLGALLVAICMGAALGAAYFVKSANEWRRVRKALGDVPRIAIAEVNSGRLARVVGVVHAAETLVAPLSGERCVYYEVTVRPLDGSTRSIVHEQRGVPFVLADETGRALVDPAVSRAFIVQELEESGTFDSSSPRQYELLARHGKASKRALSRQRIVYREAIIAPGETISVTGEGVREPDPDAPQSGYREPAPTRLRMSGSAQVPLLMSDDPRTLAQTLHPRRKP